MIIKKPNWRYLRCTDSESDTFCDEVCVCIRPVIFSKYPEYSIFEKIYILSGTTISIIVQEFASSVNFISNNE